MTTSLFSTRRGHTRPRIRKALCAGHELMRDLSHCLPLLASVAAIASPFPVLRMSRARTLPGGRSVPAESQALRRPPPTVRRMSERCLDGTSGIVVPSALLWMGRCAARDGDQNPTGASVPFTSRGASSDGVTCLPVSLAVFNSDRSTTGTLPPDHPVLAMPFSLANRLEWDPIVAKAARTSAHWGFHPHRVSHPSASAAHP
ncbi:hypothetical protein B0H14DRAFT_117098 [Mycena olivaceomarginata]|nr:hypothetical protein B0H14DRAFT_117098 [Mycena olivaceomarginata]